MTIERPKSLVLSDTRYPSDEPPTAPAKTKANLLDGLISEYIHGGNNDNEEMIPTHLLDRFFDHRFKPYTEKKMQELVESIKIVGIQQPLIVRKKANGRYEILAGHNRLEAAKRAGLRTVPCEIRDIDNDAIARIIVNDTNIHRDQLSYSEKAWVYKTEIDALRSLGWRKEFVEAVESENEKSENGGIPVNGTKGSFGTPGSKAENDQFAREFARDIVAERYDTVGMQISRYLRLLELTDELLDKVDSERIPFKAGVEFSHLSKEMQETINTLLDTFKDLNVKVTSSETLHRIVKEDKNNNDLSAEDLFTVLSGKPLKKKQKTAPPVKPPFKMIFKSAEKQFKKLDEDTIQSIDQGELEKVIVDAVEQYIRQIRREEH